MSPPERLPDLDRREFLRRSSALGVAAGSLPWLPAPQAFPPPADDDRPSTLWIPTDKGLDPEWIAGLRAPGGPRIYRAASVRHVALPMGGIGAGEVHLTGDGRLVHWAVYNQPRPFGPLFQEVLARVETPDGEVDARPLHGAGFDDCSFRSEYPFAEVHFGTRARRPFPLEICLEAWNPRIPHQVQDSCLPLVVTGYSLRNRLAVPIRVKLLASWLNGAGLSGPVRGFEGVGLGGNVQRAAQGPGWLGVFMAANGPSGERAGEVVFADFEGRDYGAWKSEGAALGSGPAPGTLPGQNAVSGFEGRGLVNTYLGGDDQVGVLTSPEFLIEKPYINFLIGGGSHEGTTCLNLLQGRQVVRSATGRNDERLSPAFFDVRGLMGQRARLQIVDAKTGGWGHVNVDHIVFAEAPPPSPTADATFLLAAATEPEVEASVHPGWDENLHLPLYLVARGELPPPEKAEPSPPGRTQAGSLLLERQLAPGETWSPLLLWAWHRPRREVRGREVGTRYAEWFADASEVGAFFFRERLRLHRQADLFRRTYLDSTLPRWLLDRLMMPVTTLSTETCQIWRNGRFWAWEGVGCCAGTCTHVWNYEQALARLWPALARTTREMQDLGEGFDPESGLVGFRGGRNYAADGQAGTVLKCWREHLLSPDSQFLERTWPRVKRVLEFQVGREGGEQGLLTGVQHNTYDINFVGPNTFVGSLFLAALRAGEEMARLMGEESQAQHYRQIFERGRQQTVEKLWNGEYFQQKQSGRDQYGPGCLADQLFGQTWSHQVGLGHLYPVPMVESALRSVFRYNWAPCVRRYNETYPPERWFLSPEESGLLICVWPRGGRPEVPVRYRDEVWTGIEYQLASGLLSEGLVDEAMIVLQALDHRYDGIHRNPWNEVECGDHYARALASFGCLVAASGLHLDGPAGHIAFDPRLSPDDFRAFASFPEGFGTLEQRRLEGRQSWRVSVAAGTLTLKSLTVFAKGPVRPEALQLESDPRAGPVQFRAEVQQKNGRSRLALEFRDSLVLAAGQELRVLVR